MGVPAAALVVWCATQEAALPPMPPAAGHGVDFAADVAPIFERACVRCHGPERARSDYRLDDEESALHGGTIGGAIVAGHSDRSRLIHYVAGADEQIRMPLRGEPLSDAEIGVLRRWIDDGAPWPKHAEPRPTKAPAIAPPRAGRDHWAYQPIVRGPLPRTEAAWWIANPIDAFVLAKLEAARLHPNPPADRATLLRRVSFDLAGLPPTPEEQAAFLADTAPGAWERVVDRLLASPRYGERRARQWIDLVHFAETHGNDQDRPRPDAWPYRDWLIGAFNADLPYATFVQQQLAADVLFPDEPAAVPALGFLAAGPWDESSQLNIFEETVDKAAARNLDRDDVVTTTMTTFVSTTVQCARCHDHKFDPIAQRDHYALQAVFAGIDRAVRPYDLDPALHARRQALLRRKLALERAPPTAPELLADEVQRDVAAFERSLAGTGGSWTVLAPGAVVSASGQTATPQPDGSLLFSGELPEVDTVTVTTTTPLRAITALRVDLLSDESLPFRGPGRQDNGNLHLSELTLAAAPSDSPDAAPQTIAFAAASADFDQEGWTSAMAIDGKRETAWGIYPQVGRSHHAVFELAQPLDLAGGARLVVTLAQLHGGHHLIGRLRLAITSAPRPVRAATVPAALEPLLAIAPPTRSDEQRAALGRHVLLAALAAELATLPPPSRVYAGTTDFAPENHFTPARGPRPIRLLERGDVARPGEPVEPAALSCVAGLEATLAIADRDDEGARRAALACWLTDARNSLAWRSIVNRAWQWHFGRGLVDTPSDFGAMGGTPSHPELLDWLAAWFRDEAGGSLKALDRLIVSSAAYRQSSRFDERAAAIDADARLLWRHGRARLDAEAIRDALLQIAGRLDLTMGGPSVKQFIESPGIHVTPNVDYDAFDVDSPASCRRSIYRFLFRTLPDPFLETLDCPDASQLAPVRASSVTPLQSLALLHDRFVLAMSGHVATRVAAAAQGGDAQLALLFRLVLGRVPTDDERASFGPFVARHGLADAARLLFNTSEFLFVE